MCIYPLRDLMRIAARRRSDNESKSKLNDNKPIDTAGSLFKV